MKAVLRVGAFSAVVAMVLPAVAMAQASAPPQPARCSDDPALNTLDFLIGSWVVADSMNAKLGTNVLEKAADGCAITELWHDPDGSESRGLFYYVVRDRRWEMTLSTPAALSLGGFRQRHLVAVLPTGAVRFLGETIAPNGTVLNRLTFAPVSGGRARETIEVSRDGGQTWQRTFDGFYSRSRR
jgi:hypothetical protein